MLQTTSNRAYTFHIGAGQPSFVGVGDLHDTSLDEHRKSIWLTDRDSFYSNSTGYVLSLYPTQAFFDSYETRNPLLATIGAVAIMFFTSLAFFLYDTFVRIEFHNKQAVLEAKRKFMRFVSHEVRTPLNR